MGDPMNLFQHLARAAAEMLMQRDPYPDEYIQPKITGMHKDRCGHMVIEVTASNYRDVERVCNANFPGRTVHVHVGRNKWEVRQEEQ